MLDEKDLQLFEQLMDRKFQAFSQDMDQKFQEASQETDRKFQESSQETDRKFQAFSQDMDQKFQAFSQEVDQKIQAAEQRITKNTVIMMEAEFAPRFDLLAEAIQNVEDKLIPRTRVEELEEEVKFLRLIVKNLAEDVDELKKVN